MYSFYVTLVSDSSKKTYPNNTLYNFTTKLPNNLTNNKENWEVALVEIIHPSQIININRDDIYFYLVTRETSIGYYLNKAGEKYKYEHKTYTYTFKSKIHEGVYSGGKLILNEININLQMFKTYF